MKSATGFVVSSANAGGGSSRNTACNIADMHIPQEKPSRIGSFHEGQEDNGLGERTVIRENKNI